MKSLETAHKELIDLWEGFREEYEEHLDSQKFKRDSEQAEGWITAQDTWLKNDDLVRYDLLLHIDITCQNMIFRNHWMQLKRYLSHMQTLRRWCRDKRRGSNN